LSFYTNVYYPFGHLQETQHPKLTFLRKPIDNYEIIYSFEETFEVDKLKHL